MFRVELARAGRIGYRQFGRQRCRLRRRVGNDGTAAEGRRLENLGPRLNLQKRANDNTHHRHEQNSTLHLLSS
jgi:hypothetical protein